MRKIMDKVLDLLFYISGNKLIYSHDFKYVMFRKFGSVLVSLYAFYSLLVSLNLPIFKIIFLILFTMLVYIVIVYHAVSSAIISKSYSSYTVITVVLIGAWVANGYYFIEAKFITNKKELVVFNEDKYLKLKNELEVKKRVYLNMDNYYEKIDNLKKIDINSEASKMLKLRKADKRAYYTTYIKPMKGKINLPSISKKMSDDEVLELLKKVVTDYRDYRISNIEREIELKSANKLIAFNNEHLEDINYLKSISKSYIDRLNRSIEIENKELASSLLKEKIIYSIIFLILGVFFELIVFANSWITLDTDKKIVDIDLQVDRLKEVVRVSDGFKTFVTDLQLPYNAKSATIYAMIVYLLEFKRDVNFNTSKHFKINSLKIAINPETKKPYRINRYISVAKKAFETLDLNYSNLNVDSIKKLYKFI